MKLFRSDGTPRNQAVSIKKWIPPQPSKPLIDEIRETGEPDFVLWCEGHVARARWRTIFDARLDYHLAHRTTGSEVRR